MERKREGPGEELLDDPTLTRERLLAALRDRRASAGLFRRAAGDRRWTRFGEVRRLVVLDKRTPLAAARSLVPYLGWRDLAEVCSDVRTPPLVRRAAESALEARLGEMAVGEQVALARRAGRSMVKMLAASEEERVLEALLANPRFVEEDALAVAGRADCPPTVLEALSRHARWSARRAVRLAVVGNRATPVAAALKVVAALDATDLRRLSRDDRVPSIVRIAAERSLKASG